MKLNKKSIGLIVTSVVALGGICIGTIFLQKNTESEKNYCSNMYNLEQIFQEQKEVEIGSTVPTIKDFLTNANELTECSLDNLELSFEEQDEFIKDNKLTKTGNYTYVISNKKDEYGFTYTLKVVDTNQPQVELQDLTIKEGEEYKITDFIVSVTDNSNEEVTYNYVKEEMRKYSKSGEYEIKILFKDKSGNEYEDSTTLKIEKSDNQKEESSSKSTTSSENKTNSNNTSTTTKNNGNSTSKGSSTSGGSTTSKSNSTSGNSTNKSSKSSGSSSSNDTVSCKYTYKYANQYGKTFTFKKSQLGGLTCDQYVNGTSSQRKQVTSATHDICVQTGKAKTDKGNDIVDQAYTYDEVPSNLNGKYYTGYKCGPVMSNANLVIGYKLTYTSYCVIADGDIRCS